MLFGLTSLGIVHTLISIVAVVAGFYALVQNKQITPRTSAGNIYFWTTVATCITGFGIFQHGGFGKPHALGIITLVTLGVAWLAGNRRVFGRASRYVETLGYTLTLFFHLVPAFTEGTTRLPLGAPTFSSPDAPQLQQIIGITFVVFLVIMVAQAIWLRAAGRGKIAVMA